VKKKSAFIFYLVCMETYLKFLSRGKTHISISCFTGKSKTGYKKQMPLWTTTTKRLLTGLLSIDGDLDATRDHIFGVLEELQRRSRLWIVPSKRRKAIIEYGGLEVLKATIKNYLKDELMVAVCLQLLASLLVDSEVDVKLALTVNLKSVLQKVVDHYHSTGDPYTFSDVKRILKFVRQAECRVATEEISNMLAALQHDISLQQESISFILKYSNPGRILPSVPHEVMHKEFGINRALQLMSDYDYEDVVICGLQLILTYISKNGTKTMCTPICVQTILNIMSRFPESRRVQRRGCSIIIELCESADGRRESIRNGALTSMMEWHSRLQNDIGCRQLSLLCISSLCNGKFPLV